MFNSKADGKRYIRAINRKIKCLPKDKSDFLEHFKAEISDYYDEFPEADYADLCKEYGEPTGIASDFMESESLARKKYSRFKVYLSLTAVVISAIVMILYFVAFRTQSIHIITEAPEKVSTTIQIN